MRVWSHPIARTLLAGTLLGLVILGAGGRLVMAAITANAGGTPSFTLGGTTTVVMLGAASGFAGAVLALISRVITTRLPTRYTWTQYVLLALLLLLITMRGLRGTSQVGTGYFYTLVALYGISLVLFMARRPRPPTGA